MVSREWVEAFCQERDCDVLLADGFEAALVGVGRRFNTYVAIYDMHQCLAVLCAQGMTEDEADEYFEFNVVGAHVGDQTPIFLDTECK